MSSLNELYQEVILDHNQHPRNWGKLEQPDAIVAEGYNPLCGDRFTVSVKVADGRIEEIKVQGSGCAISKASASMMTSEIKGKTLSETEALSEKFRDMVKGEAEADADDMGKLEVFSGVSEFPARVKCATLAWHTLQAALHQQAETVSTEDTE
jgi:nitrogen fixation NifU-like protein